MQVPDHHQSPKFWLQTHGLWTQTGYIYIYIYTYIYIERESGGREIDWVIQGEIYWETKSRRLCLGSKEPSSGQGEIILVMLNQRWILKNTQPSGKSIYREGVGRLISKSAFVFKIALCNLVGIYHRIYMFPLFIEIYFESKREKK